MASAPQLLARPWEAPALGVRPPETRWLAGSRRLLLISGDLMTVMLTWVATTEVLHGTLPSAVSALLLAGIWLGCLVLVDGYAPQIPADRTAAALSVLKCAPLVTSILLLGEATGFVHWSAALLLVTAAAGTVALAASRLTWGHRLVSEELLLRVVLAGTPAELESMLTQAEGASINDLVVGLASLPRSGPASVAFEIEELAERTGAHQVVMDSAEAAASPMLVEQLVERGLCVVSMGDLIERIHARIPLGEVDSRWLLDAAGRHFWGKPYLAFGRLAELAVAGLAGLLLILLLPLLGLLIKLDSPGPVLIRQRRIGRLGRSFQIHKLRSMRVDAELDGPLWAARGDVRVTRVGRVLRATRLDELPQMLNVLRGEMSLIGPRPERPEFVAILEQQIPHYRARLIARPGLTGWAQIKQGYAGTAEQAVRKLEYDLYYVKHRGLRLDLKIAVLTLFAVVGLRGR